MGALADEPPNRRLARRTTRVCLASLILAANAAAAEEHLKPDASPHPNAVEPAVERPLDLRLVYGFGGAEYSVHMDPSRSISSDQLGWEQDRLLRVDVIGGRNSPLSLSGGFALAGQMNDQERSRPGMDYQSVSGRLGFGLAVSPSEHFQLEIQPFAGYGMAEFEGVRERDRNEFFEYGLNVNAVFSAPGSFQFGAGVGWLVNEGDFGVSAPGERPEVQVGADGPVYKVFVGTKL